MTTHQPIVTGKILIMMMGLPRSGKSTWALQQGIPIVDLDAIRLVKTGQRWWGPIEHEVYATARTMIRALFVAGHSHVILDITGYCRKQRDAFISSSDIPWKRYVMIIDTDIEVCKKRAEESYPELVDIIDYIHENWEVITELENIGFWGAIKNGRVILRQLPTRFNRNEEGERLVESAGRTS